MRQWIDNARPFFRNFYCHALMCDNEIPGVGGIEEDDTVKDSLFEELNMTALDTENCQVTDAMMS